MLTPREQLLFELCTPRSLRTVSLCGKREGGLPRSMLRAPLPADISVNSNTRIAATGSSLRKKLTPSAAFINELKNKVM